MVQVSCCTFVKNVIKNDYPVEHWINQHADLFDDLVIVDTGSDDGTFDLIKGYDKKNSKVQVFLIPVIDEGNNDWFRKCKSLAIRNTKFNSVLYLDVDEFIHEKDAKYIYEFAKTMQHHNIDGRLAYRQFLGNTFTEMATSTFGYTTQTRLFRKDRPFDIHVDGGGMYNQGAKTMDCKAEIFHYGYVRDLASLDWNKSIQHNRFEDNEKAKELLEEDPEYPINLAKMLKNHRRLKVFGEFPRVVRENIEDFFEIMVDPFDNELLEKYV
jgi:glycosyltransferase involved in cell wall biosynthesis